MKLVNNLLSRKGGRARLVALTFSKLFIALILLATTSTALGAAPLQAQSAPEGPEALPPGWTEHYVDKPLNLIELTDRTLRIKKTGEPCAVYGGDMLYYACFDKGTNLWGSPELVDNRLMVGSHAALAFNDNDDPFISYYDGFNGDLWLAYNIGGTGWQYKLVDATVLLDQDSPKYNLSPYSQDQIEALGLTIFREPTLAPTLEPSAPQVESVPKGVGKYTSIAVDNLGYVHISYYDDSTEVSGLTGGRLKYARWSGFGDPVTVVVHEYHDQGDAGLFTSIAVDADRKVHISYMSEKYDYLMYAVGGANNPAAWTYYEIDRTPQVGPYTSIALDEYGRPHISYIKFLNGVYSLRYARKNNDGSWSGTVIDGPGVGLYSSIAIDSKNRPHISYYDVLNGNLKYAYYNGSSWNTMTIDQPGDTGYFTSIAIDSLDQPNIYYYNLTTGYLNYIYYDPYLKKWVRSPLKIYTGDVGLATSLALSSGGVPHISYLDDTRDYLKYATAIGWSWSLDVVTDTIRAGSHSSIKLLNDSIPVIAFYDMTHADLVLARGDNLHNTWDFEYVDWVGNVGQYVSMELDSANNPHMSYYDGTNGRLIYNHWDGSDWNRLDLDWGWVGLFSSLALNAADKPFISYFDVPDERIMLALKSPTNAWVKVPIADVGIPGDDIQVLEAYTSIDLDPLGNPHIAYYNDTLGSLEYAYDIGGGVFAYETIDNSVDVVGKWVSLAVDPATGISHVCYYDETNGDLKYAYRNGGWTSLTMDSYGDVGLYCSLDLDSTSRVGISYYDRSGGDLKYIFSDTLPFADFFLPLIIVQ